MINEELTSITKKSGIIFIGRIIGAILGFFFSIMAARFMGAAAFGKISYVLTIITMLTVITKLGLSQGMVQFVSKLTDQKNYKKRNSLITFSLSVVLFLSVIFTILLYFNSKFLAVEIFKNPDIISLLKIMSPFLILFTLLDLIPSIFRGLKIIRYQVIGKSILVSFLKLFIVIIVGYLGYKIMGLVITYYISFIAIFIYFLIKIKKHKLLGRLEKEYINEYKNLIVFSLPLLVSGLIHFLIGKIDIFMIGYFLNSADVGIYTITIKLGTFTNFLLYSINSIFAPTITSLYYNDNKYKLKKLYQVLTKWTFAANLAMFLLVIILSKDILKVYSAEFAVGWFALILITGGQLINAGVGSAGQMNVMTGFPHSELYVSIIVFLINALLNFFLIPIYGIEGAAFSSLISIGVMNVIRLFILYQRLGFLPYNKKYLPVIYSALLAFIVSFLMKPYINTHYFIRLMIIGSVFMGINIFSNIKFGLETEDLLILNKILDKLNISKNI